MPQETVLRVQVGGGTFGVSPEHHQPAFLERLLDEVLLIANQLVGELGVRLDVAELQVVVGRDDVPDVHEALGAVVDVKHLVALRHPVHHLHGNAGDDRVAVLDVLHHVALFQRPVVRLVEGVSEAVAGRLGGFERGFLHEVGGVAEGRHRRAVAVVFGASPAIVEAHVGERHDVHAARGQPDLLERPLQAASREAVVHPHLLQRLSADAGVDEQVVFRRADEQRGDARQHAVAAVRLLASLPLHLGGGTVHDAAVDLHDAVDEHVYVVVANRHHLDIPPFWLG